MDSSCVFIFTFAFQLRLGEIVMAEKEQALLLTESDIPGAGLGSKSVDDLNVDELKRWLACRGARCVGKKPELQKR